MDNSFTIGGRDFKISKIDAFKQFHIVRRLGPILADIIPAMQGSVKNAEIVEKLSKEEQLDMVVKFATPIMTGLSKLSDSDSELVLFGLLSAVEIKHSGSWSKVATSSMLMIQDLELPMLIQIAARSFMFNLSGFFSALPRQ